VVSDIESEMSLAILVKAYVLGYVTIVCGLAIPRHVGRATGDLGYPIKKKKKMWGCASEKKNDVEAWL
jgi:hypothetical protein